MGWARGKFASWVAATRAKPGEPVIVSDDRLNEFLKAQRIGTLPLDPDTHRRLWQLGLRVLGDLIALPEQAVVSQFGREGRIAWRLATGTIVEPVIGKEAPPSVMAAMDFPTPIADQSILDNTICKLTDQALRHPRRAGWRVRSVRARYTRARFVVDDRCGPQGSVGESKTHSDTAHYQTRTDPAHRRGRASGGGIHRVRPRHKGAAAVRSRRRGRSANRTAARVALGGS